MTPPQTEEKPLVHDNYLLQKFPGKGGWTYAEIPEVLQNKKSPFGWVSVRGSIDDFVLEAYKLMPMGNGRLFLPVKAEIRKKIGKRAGDYVLIKLFANTLPLEIPLELKQCLEIEPGAYETFIVYSSGEQKAFIDWIYSAKTDETKAERISKTMDKLLKREKFYDKPLEH